VTVVSQPRSGPLQGVCGAFDRQPKVVESLRKPRATRGRHRHRHRYITRCCWRRQGQPGLLRYALARYAGALWRWRASRALRCAMRRGAMASRAALRLRLCNAISVMRYAEGAMPCCALRALWAKRAANQPRSGRVPSPHQHPRRQRHGATIRCDET
jgi:hypothetical protein